MPKATFTKAKSGTRPAVFLDRDGTVIEHVHYLSDPSKVRLLTDAGQGLRRLQKAGYALVVVTNQSAIGRGALTIEQYDLVTDEMNRLLLDEGVSLDGIYYCPEVSTSDNRTEVTHDDRKPGPGMLLRAADELGLSLAESWMVGDLISDVLAGINAGCRGSFLVETGKPILDEIAQPDFPFSIKANLSAVADVILGSADDRAMTDDPETLRTSER